MDLLSPRRVRGCSAIQERLLSVKGEGESEKGNQQKVGPVGPNSWVVSQDTLMQAWEKFAE